MSLLSVLLVFTSNVNLSLKRLNLCHTVQPSTFLPNKQNETRHLCVPVVVGHQEKPGRVKKKPHRARTTIVQNIAAQENVSFLKVKKTRKKKKRLVREKACNENVFQAGQDGGCKYLNVLNAECLLLSSFKFKQLLCEFHLNKEKKNTRAGWLCLASRTGFWHKSKVNPDVWAGLSA